MMNGKRIFIVSALMALALIGLVVLQVSWIRRDLDIREERFAHQVSEALNRVSEKLETGETVHIITRSLPGIVNDTIIRYFSSQQPMFPVPPEVPEIDLPDSLVFERSETYSFEYCEPLTVFADGDSGSQVNALSAGRKVTVAVSGPNPGMQLQMKKAAKELAKAREDMARVRAELQKYNNQQVQIEWERKAQVRRMEKLDKAVEQMAREYELRDKRLAERILPASVDSMIGSELRNQGVAMAYSVVLRDNADSVVYSRLTTPSVTREGKKFEASLFPDNIVHRGDHMEVIFADTMVYFLSSIWIRLLSSALFTAVIIFIFTYTMHIILRQKKLSEMKNDFINNMTHEFKTPIATIRLASEALVNPSVSGDAEKLRYYARVIRDENERMNTHVENILQLARFNKNGISLSLVSTDPGELIRSCMAKVHLQAEQKGATIDFIDHTRGMTVDADPALLEIVIVNLLDNAIKYCTETPRIYLSAGIEKDDLVIEVSDNGIGISGEAQRHIFEKFYRVPKGNIHDVKGFGLGLSYAGIIVAAHHGTIQVKSELGKGSTFRVSIPLKQETAATA